jgi:hypothetical protein
MKGNFLATMILGASLIALTGCVGDNGTSTPQTQSDEQFDGLSLSGEPQIYVPNTKSYTICLLKINPNIPEDETIKINVKSSDPQKAGVILLSDSLTITNGIKSNPCDHFQIEAREQGDVDITISAPKFKTITSHITISKNLTSSNLEPKI